jgi:hypothetical protein
MEFRCRGRRVTPRGPILGAGERLEDRHLLATFLVTNLLDAGAGSLRDAVSQANEAVGADTIRFAQALAGTIVLATGQLDVVGNLFVDGPGAARLAVSGNDSSRIFALKGPDSRLSIDDITLSDGRATDLEAVGPGLVRGGAIRNDGGTLLLARVTFTGNRAFSDPSQPGAAAIVGGGAVVNSSGAILRASDCTFIGNMVEGGTRYAFGGAVANVTDARAFLTRCTFTGNSATGPTAGHGGAVGNFGASLLVVEQGSFAGNEARGADGSEAPATGGAIATRPGTVSTSGSRTTITAAQFRGNRAISAGGNASGGALASVDSSLTVSRGGFVANEAIAGGAGQASGGAIDASSLFGDVSPITRLGGCRFESNQAVGGVGGFAIGGACANAEGTMTIDRTSFIGNVARLPSQALPGSAGASPSSGAYGGAISNGSTPVSSGGAVATLVLRSSNVSRNHAVAGVAGTAAAGGLFNGNLAPGTSPVVRTVASRFVGNTPPGFGTVPG